MTTIDYPERSKVLGQFFTPQNVAQFMARWVCENKPDTILDPGIGHCTLSASCKQYSPESKIIGYDIDETIESYISNNVFFDIDLRIRDYLTDWGYEYDGIICNPPYNKFQTICNRDFLRTLFIEKTGVKLSGYTNIMGYFLIKSISELKINGRSAFIVPYEFLNTGYGTQIKEYLVNEKILVGIIKFDNHNSVFDDAITTTCILLMEKSQHERISFINCENVEFLEKINFSHLDLSGINRHICDISPANKWLSYFIPDELNSESDLGNNPNMVKLSTIGKVMRGIATGDNPFFTLTREKIEQLNISKDCIVPCICKSADVNTIIFTKNDFESLVSKNKKMYIFDGEKASSSADFEYIKFGENSGSSSRYLTSHRTPWFQIENKKIAPILIGVFNRDYLKVVKNEAMVANLTTFHGLHLRSNYDDDTCVTVIFCYLFSDVSKPALFCNKREYGDNLDKFEPNDLNNAYILDPHVISTDDIIKINDAFSTFKSDNDEVSFKNKLNLIFKPYVDGKKRPPCKYNIDTSKKNFGQQSLSNFL